MQTDTQQRTDVEQDVARRRTRRQTKRHTGSSTRFAAFRVDRRDRAGSVAGDQAQRHGRLVRRQQDRGRDDQGLSRSRRRHCRRFVARSRTGRASLVDQMSATFERRFPSGGTLHIEDIQDQVELALMRSGEHKVARDYVLYRDSRARARAERKPVAKPTQTNLIDHARRRHPRTARRRAPAHRRERSVRRPQRRRRRADHRRSTEQHVRRHLRKRRRHVGADHRANAGRRRAELHVRHRAHPARRSARRSARVPRRSGARRNGRRLPRDAIADARGLSRSAEGVHRPRRRARTRVGRPAQVRPRRARRSAEAGARPQLHLPRPADAVRPLLHPQQRRALRTAASVLHARCDGSRARRSRPHRARDRVLRSAVVVRLHEFHADAVQRRHAALAVVVVFPDHGAGRSRRHLPRHSRQRDAVEMGRRPRQRLDAGACARRLHQRHERQVAGRSAVPESGQRHRGRGEPGRQAQRRRVLVPRNVAPRHRGIHRAAQEHRRRPPPHARHEHRQLDSRPVHEARLRRRHVDAVLAERRARPARPVRPRVRTRATRNTNARPKRANCRCSSASARRTCGARCCRCCSKPGIRGSRSKTRATSARRSSTSASCIRRTSAPRSR